MKVYVAAKFENTAEVREIYALLRSAGHEITHDWTHESAEGKSGDVLVAYLRGCAAADVRGVKDCDALVLLPHERGKGLYVELGIALADGKKVVCIGEQAAFSCIFFHLEGVKWIASKEGLLEAVEA